MQSNVDGIDLMMSAKNMRHVILLCMLITTSAFSMNRIQKILISASTATIINLVFTSIGALANSYIDNFPPVPTYSPIMHVIRTPVIMRVIKYSTIGAALFGGLAPIWAPEDHKTQDDSFLSGFLIGGVFAAATNLFFVRLSNYGIR